MQTLQEQCDQWKTNFESYCKKAFPKIRIRPKKSKVSEADKLIEKRNSLKKKQDDDKTSKEEDNNLEVLELQIAQILAEEGRQKAYQFKKFCAENGSVNVKEMSIPTGKINHKGKLVTSPEEIKILLHKEYKERLRPRPRHPNLEYIEELKCTSFKIKLEEAKDNKSPEWTMSDLNNVLNDIKKNKARDTYGINRSIFHTYCIGSDL